MDENKLPPEGPPHDGIREDDNRLPRWWLWTFYSTVVFGFFYFMYYKFERGPTLEQIYQSDLAAYQASRPKENSLDQAKFAAQASRPEFVQSGKVVFVAKCAVCHGSAGEGNIGPNLTDAFWIHGDGTAPAVFKTISEGILEKGMPAWSLILTGDELQQVTAYALSLGGTRPANPKAPQGTEIKRN